DHQRRVEQLDQRLMKNPTTQPSRGVTLWRGLTRRCPRCGGGNLFKRWFRMVPDCPRCALHFEREPGYWVGAVAINTMVIGMLFTLSRSRSARPRFPTSPG